MIIRFLTSCALILSCAGVLLALSGSLYQPLDSFAHFLHYYVLALFLTGLLAHVMGMRRTRTVTLIFVLIGILSFDAARPFAFAMNKSEAESQLKVLTFNLLFKNGQVEEIASYIATEDPDVLLLQEVSSANLALMDKLDAYPHRQTCALNRFMSAMVLSKHKPTLGGCLQKSRLAWMQISTGKQQMRVVSAHLHWPWPFGQWTQIEEIDQEIAIWRSDIPIVFGGDFNAAPWSHAVHRIEDIIRAKVTPGFRLTLFGYKSLFKMPVIVPIDHVLLPTSASAISAKVGPYLGSDHRPVSVEFAFVD